MEYMQVNRANGRAANELRPVKLTRGVMKHAHDDSPQVEITVE